ncbi:polysaccharide pyruvyl transferase family protein [Streptomyces caniscabiei]|uniref:polysaccharide pyruvyl transferase family protein n=1 Tax=Streptomyces caniscabiei TaxID=2746961 RepID=UPI0029BE5EA6|nr:polysaccharide pyruvyl transferase family protein [Streptomyces caniscabiei]MDX2776121.1 polysaccharide pyruvyl transferase family protein [Streptomyces caniscabiei]
MNILKKTKKALIPLYQRITTFMSRGELALPDNTNRAFIFLTPDYGNIGDLAIGYAQQKFLEDNLPGYTVFSIPVADTYKYLRHIKKHIKQDDVIFLVGGGSFGDLYPKADFGRVFLTRYFRKNRVCFFPQTMVFRDTEYGRQRLAATRKAFDVCDNLTLVARERQSYAAMQKQFNNPVLLSPDIVFSLLPDMQAKAVGMRDGIVFTLRADEEKFVAKEKEDALVDFVKAQYGPVQFRDTTVDPARFEYAKRDFYIQDTLDLYRRSRLVITDRLHGMIFAFITGTPCIVLPNANHKIKGTYDDWLSDCNYITLLNDVDLATVKRTIDAYFAVDFQSNYAGLTVEFTALKEYLADMAKDGR